MAEIKYTLGNGSPAIDQQNTVASTFPACSTASSRAATIPDSITTGLEVIDCVLL